MWIESKQQPQWADLDNEEITTWFQYGTSPMKYALALSEANSVFTLWDLEPLPASGEIWEIKRIRDFDNLAAANNFTEQLLKGLPDAKNN